MIVVVITVQYKQSLGEMYNSYHCLAAEGHAADGPGAQTRQGCPRACDSDPGMQTAGRDRCKVDAWIDDIVDGHKMLYTHAG